MTKSISSQRKAAAPRGPMAPLSVSWSLPSGLSLAEFGLRFGFLAPSVIGGDRRNKSDVAALARLAEAR